MTASTQDHTASGPGSPAPPPRTVPGSTSGRPLSLNGCYVRRLCKAAPRRAVVPVRDARSGAGGPPSCGPGPGGARPRRAQQASTSFSKAEQAAAPCCALLNPVAPPGFNKFQQGAGICGWPPAPPASCRASRFPARAPGKRAPCRDLPVFVGICRYWHKLV